MKNVINRAAAAKLILVPKGDDSRPCLKAFQAASGIAVPEFNGRQLEAKAGQRTFLKVKGRDIPRLVAAGYGDLGLTGSDSCEEYAASADAGISYQTFGPGMCRFVLLAPRRTAAAIHRRLKDNKLPMPVVTSFPNLLDKCARRLDLPLEVSGITVSGSVEIMPRLLDVPLVADLVSSGTTARANGLVEVATLSEVYPAVVVRDVRQPERMGEPAMKTYSNPPVPQWPALCRRPSFDGAGLELTIAGIFQTVRKSGDAALLAYTERFDSAAIDSVAVSRAQLANWAAETPDELKEAIGQAYQNIRKFHQAQKSVPRPIVVETRPGVRCWREARPIERVGLYVPGGSAPLLSTALMLGVPAQLAGCQEIVLCTPPRADGSISPSICYAAELVGATTVLRVGGAQAIAAMAYGTPSVPRVDKLFGPGNQYVTAAKLYASRLGVAIDMPAGPSEVMVVADASARPDFVAADLLSQAEHGPDSQVVLVTTDAMLSQTVFEELDKQLPVLSRREIVEQSLAKSFCVVLPTVEKALAFANAYAPEHLILSVSQAQKAARQVQNAGSVFLGNYSPESAGDYASGPNHTLPTNGWARSYGGLSLESFCKYVTFQSLTKQGAKDLAPTVMAMAGAEGLEAHRRAMEIRL